MGTGWAGRIAFAGGGRKTVNILQPRAPGPNEYNQTNEKQTPMKGGGVGTEKHHYEEGRKENNRI